MTKLRIHKVLIQDNIYIKILAFEDSFYAVFRPMDALGDDIEIHLQDDKDNIFESEEAAIKASKKQTSFKRLLLKKSQRSFYDEDIYEEINKEFQEFKAKIPKPSEEEIRREKAKIEEKRQRKKQEMLGNIRFIGEIYKENMIKEHIVHECILSLIGHEVSDPVVSKDGKQKNKTKRELVQIQSKKDILKDEDTLEALCKFLSTVGEKMERQKKELKGPKGERHRNDFEFYFQLLKEKAEDKHGLPSRMRFMIQNVLDLRKSEWIESKNRKEEKAEKIEDIRKRAEQEEGINFTSQIKPRRQSQVGIDLQQTSEQQHGRHTSNSNLPSQKSRDYPNRRNSNDINTYNSNMPVHTRTMSNHMSSSKPDNIPIPAALDDQKIKDKVSNMVDEYIHLKENEEAILCYNEMRQQRIMDDNIIFQLFSKLIDAKPDDRTKIYDLLSLLLTPREKDQPRFRNMDMNIQGIKEICDILEDTAIDEPQAYNIAGKFIYFFCIKHKIHYDWILEHMFVTDQMDPKNYLPTKKLIEAIFLNPEFKGQVLIEYFNYVLLQQGNVWKNVSSWYNFYIPPYLKENPLFVQNLCYAILNLCPKSRKLEYFNSFEYEIPDPNDIDVVFGFLGLACHALGKYHPQPNPRYMDCLVKGIEDHVINYLHKKYPRPNSMPKDTFIEFQDLVIDHYKSILSHRFFALRMEQPPNQRASHQYSYQQYPQYPQHQQHQQHQHHSSRKYQSRGRGRGHR